VDAYDIELSFIRIGGQRSVAEKAGRVEPAAAVPAPDTIRTDG